MSQEKRVHDIAGKDYWDTAWGERTITLASNPHDTSLRNQVNLYFHDFFTQLFTSRKISGGKLLEVGCAGSAWLPYFAREFGFEVHGLDYSPLGCEQARQVLKNAGVIGQIYCEDFFKPPEMLIEKFDVVISFGVVEHFDDPVSCIFALARFLKPGGLLITIVPNMTGLIGTIQKIINRPVYKIHHLLDKDSLCKSHQDASMQVVDCSYFIFNNFGICNLTGLPNNTVSWYCKKILLAILGRCSMLIWFVESRFHQFKPTKLLSPYIKCIAIKGS